MKNGILIGCHQGLKHKEMSKIKNVIQKFLKKIKIKEQILYMKKLRKTI